jgi:signal peptidase
VQEQPVILDTSLQALAPEARRQRRRRLLHLIDLSIWTSAGVASVVIAGLVTLHGVEFSRVLSPSMAPGMPVGSIAVTRHIPAEQLKVGQVVILHAPANNARYIHRVIELNFAPRESSSTPRATPIRPPTPGP